MMRLSSSLEQISLSNDVLSVSVLPEPGAKILDLVDLRSGQNFLWRNPRIAPQRYPIEANFDNYWCGGWDDAFPSCEACTYNGEIYPNLGELRSLAWQIESHIAGESITLSAAGPISPVIAEKTILLDSGTLEMSFSIRHVGHLPIDFLWGTHPAYAIAPDCVLHIPAGRGKVGQANDPLLGEPGQSYAWPILETPHGARDMSRVLSPGKLSAGHYALELTAGWYALEYPERQSGLLFEFPLQTCPYLWLWLSYGGWRGHYVAVIEPYTSCPVTLSEAVAAKTHRVLNPGETFSCAIRATPWMKPASLQTLLEERATR